MKRKTDSGTKTLQEALYQQRTETEQGFHAEVFMSRKISLFLLALMVMTIAALPAAFAEQEWHLFETIAEYTEGEVPDSAAAVMQRIDHKETVNNVEITILEAGYDGRTLFLEYSFRMPDVDKPLGITAGESYGDELPEGMDPDKYIYGMTDDAEELLFSHNVGWWVDGIWVNGKELGDMPDGSGQYMTGTGNPGELLETDVWRLDNVGVSLEGKTQISLPIGEQQDYMDYSPYEHPEKADEDGRMLLPDKGMITFEYDATGIPDMVRLFNPEIEYTMPLAAVTVTEAAFTPVMTYIRLDLEVNPEALEDYIQENGEGFKDEDGELLWPFSGMDVFGEWLESMQLTDGDANILFPDAMGPSAYSDTDAEFLFPYLETLPDDLYLAPATEDGADMANAIPVLVHFN